MYLPTNYPETPKGGVADWPTNVVARPQSVLAPPPPAPAVPQEAEGGDPGPRPMAEVARRPRFNGMRTDFPDEYPRMAPGQEARAMYAAPIMAPSLPDSWLDPCDCPPES